MKSVLLKVNNLEYLVIDWDVEGNSSPSDFPNIYNGRNIEFKSWLIDLLMPGSDNISEILRELEKLDLHIFENPYDSKKEGMTFNNEFKNIWEVNEKRTYRKPVLFIVKHKKENMENNFTQERQTVNNETELEIVCRNLTTACNSINLRNREKGFWDKELNVGEKLMLVVSELGEGMEAHRKGKFSSSKGTFLNEKDWEDPVMFSKFIKDTFEDELADAVIRIFDLAGGMGIDLGKHIESKLNFNQQRPKLHGKLY